MGFSAEIEPRSKPLIRQPQNRRLTPKRFTWLIAAFRDDKPSSLLAAVEGFEIKVQCGPKTFPSGEGVGGAFPPTDEGFGFNLSSIFFFSTIDVKLESKHELRTEQTVRACCKLPD